tara:strand:+ start:7087 stop:7323 length:237 start_codon:yes stop_codon:yes gene_type:complete
MMIENILKEMAQGKVRLTYRSLVSGKEKEVTGTLQGDKFINQRNTSDKIIFWDVENNKWEDIECNTIKAWFNLNVMEK